jgi:predicted nuclease of predicted toxin-antitoxin system
MNIWIDAQLPPTLARWLSDTFGVSATALRDLGLRDAQDTEIFDAARANFAVIMTYDSDFVDLVCRLGTPPQIIAVLNWMQLHCSIVACRGTAMPCPYFVYWTQPITAIFGVPCGNVTNRNLRQILTTTFPDALERLRQNEAIAFISRSPLVPRFY